MSTSNQSETKFNFAIELTKILIWPVLISLFVLCNWSSVRRVIDIFPDLLSNSKTITIAGMSLELNERVKSKSTPEVEEALKKMSTNDIDILLGVSDSYQVFKEEEYESFGKQKFESLVNQGLLIKQPYSNPKKEFDIELIISDKGKDVRKFLLALIKEFTRETYNNQ